MPRSARVHLVDGRSLVLRDVSVTEDSLRGVRVSMDERGRKERMPFAIALADVRSVDVLRLDATRSLLFTAAGLAVLYGVLLLTLNPY